MFDKNFMNKYQEKKLNTVFKKWFWNIFVDFFDFIFYGWLFSFSRKIEKTNNIIEKNKSPV